MAYGNAHNLSFGKKNYRTVCMILFQFHKTTKKGKRKRQEKFTEVLWAVELGVTYMFYFEGVFFSFHVLLKYVFIIK